MRRNPTWIFALLVSIIMLAGGWFALRPRETLTILALLQRKYEHEAESASIDDGIQLAMEEAGNLAGRYRLTVARRDIVPEMDVYRGLDEAVDEAVNSRIAAIIGPSRYRTRAILARLNRLGVLVVGPDDADPELTKAGFGYSNYTPDSYRPSGELNYFRVIPPDDVVGRGCAEWSVQRGWRTLYVLKEGDHYRRNDEFLKVALRLGMTIVGEGTSYEDPVERILETQPDVLYSPDESSPDWVVPEVRCLGWNGTVLLRGDQADDDLAEGTEVVSRAGPPREFAQKFTGRFGRPPGTAGWYGYRAARAVIEAIDRADSRDRNEIRRACARNPAFDTNGDTVLNELEVSVCREGRRVPVKTFTPAAPPPPPPKPVLSLSFDGTWEKYRWDVLRDEMRGTFYVDPTKIGGSGFLSSQDIQHLKDCGYEVVLGPAPPAVGPGKSLEELKALVDKALVERKPVELRFQRIDDFADPAPDLFSYQDFRELCTYINSKGFRVIPVCELRK